MSKLTPYCVLTNDASMTALTLTYANVKVSGDATLTLALCFQFCSGAIVFATSIFIDLELKDFNVS